MPGRQVEYDAVVIGAGPNGLASAITLAREGLSVLVLEAHSSIGGGTRTAELTLPGFYHDVCSAIHPLAVGSPFMATLPLEKYGLEWIYSHAEIAHPLDGEPAVMVERSVDGTAGSLDGDEKAYRRLMSPLVRDRRAIIDDFLGPLPFPPRHPFTMAGFGLLALRSASGLALGRFHGRRARAVFAGMAAHAMLPLEMISTAAYGMVIGMLAHTVGWPMARGGSQHITDGMAAYLGSLGGEVVTGYPVNGMKDLPPARAYLFDVTPRQLLKIAGDRLPSRYRDQLGRFRYGSGIFKVDYALSGPIPWKDPTVASAATAHLGGSLEEISASERAVWRGEHPERPYVLLAQQSLFDPSRAPQGRHTAWAYCHTPPGSTQDMTGCIENQIERFAPGFRELVLARHTFNAQEMEQYNPNYVGGDINGGVSDLGQLYTRPVARWSPYTTPAKDIFICSSSTPPGGGVHGMCGFYAARAALKSMKI